MLEDLIAVTEREEEAMEEKDALNALLSSEIQVLKVADIC